MTLRGLLAWKEGDAFGMMEGGSDRSPLLRRKGGLWRRKELLVCGTGALVVAMLVLLQTTRRSNTAALVDVNKALESPVEVVHVSGPSYPDPSYPGATDEDQSPQLPPEMLKEELKAEQQEKKVMKLEERQHQKEDKVEQRTNLVASYVEDEVSNPD